MQPHKIAASRVLLFDRLIDEDPGQSKESYPFRVYSREQLVVSIARELSRLLNTRCPLPRGENGGERTVLDYGLRDFSSLSASSPTDRDTMAREIKATIEAFEPRLKDVSILWAEVTTGQQQQLSANIQGKMQLGALMEPVSFPILLHASTGEAEILPPQVAEREDVVGG
jgi:type VI secretion system lysozyme-like protein